MQGLPGPPDSALGVIDTSLLTLRCPNPFEHPLISCVWGLLPWWVVFWFVFWFGFFACFVLEEKVLEQNRGVKNRSAKSLTSSNHFFHTPELYATFFLSPSEFCYNGPLLLKQCLPLIQLSKYRMSTGYQEYTWVNFKNLIWHGYKLLTVPKNLIHTMNYYVSIWYVVLKCTF